MTNARDEFVEFTQGLEILAASVTLTGYKYNRPDETTTLKVGHTQQELEVFIAALNTEYDAGYGGQELFGTIWFKDGTWATRGEYDGSEWWEHLSRPEIPADLT